MVADRRVVADVVSAPQDDVVADADERLDDVRLEDEAVLADFDLGDQMGGRAHVADQFVPKRLLPFVHRPASLVHSAEADCDEHRKVGRRMRVDERLGRQNGNPEQFVPVASRLVDSERHNLMRAVAIEIDLRDPRKVPRTEDDDGLQVRSSLRATIVNSYSP